MAESSSIKGHFSPKWRLPYSMASIVHNGIESPRLMAMMDTGAALNLMELRWAKRILKLTPEEIRTGCEIDENFSPAGGAPYKGYGWRMNLKLHRDESSEGFVLLENVLVYITDRTLKDFPILFGQDGFSDRVFVNHKKSSDQFWKLMT